MSKSKNQTLFDLGTQVNECFAGYFFDKDMAVWQETNPGVFRRLASRYSTIAGMSLWALRFRVKSMASFKEFQCHCNAPDDIRGKYVIARLDEEEFITDMEVLDDIYDSKEEVEGAIEKMSNSNSGMYAVLKVVGFVRPRKIVWE